ncbi:terminase small subunit [Halalkalibacterium ligniniphilum]|uniref:terminase small subunit n=1 Tax=Halalkalibacterium ligniniphilum TaxID=1134413 RepID=UPI000347B26A|nr:terminase small subunit [Halalkalibacterium ligniniphilum]
MNWEEIRKEYETTTITLKALAEKHDIKLGTLKSRKSREGWERDAPKKDATKPKKVATNQQRDATPQPIIENDDLNDRQKMFCLYYIKYYNATKAYQKAYGCAYSTAMVEGHRSLRNPKISEEIERLKAEQQSGVFLDAQAVLQKYIDIAFADITDFATFGKKEVIVDYEDTEDGRKPIKEFYNYVDFKESSEIDGTVVTEVKQGKDGISVKLADKMKALEMLTKYFDLLSENDKKKLQEEKLKAETDFAKARAELIKGAKKDTSLLEALIDVVKEND